MSISKNSAAKIKDVQTDVDAVLVDTGIIKADTTNLKADTTTLKADTATIKADGTAIKGLHDVPAADSAANTNIRDVIGRKDDTTSGNSIVSVLKETLQEAEYAEHHFHNRDRTYGISADQSGDNWATEDRLTPFVATSGNGDYGSDPNDEAKVFGAGDTPIIAGQTLFDPGEIIVSNVSNDNMFIVRVVWGTGTMAAAILAGQYSTKPAKFDSLNPQLTANTTVKIKTPKLAAGTKVWVQIKNNTDNSTLNFFVDAHGYE